MVMFLPAIAMFVGILAALYGVSVFLAGLLNERARVIVTLPLASIHLTAAFFLIRFGVM